MAVNINEYKPENIDLKVEKRIPLVCKQNDNITLNFNVFDYGNPVDLSTFFTEFKIQQNNGATHNQTTGITKSGNSIKIVCANEVTAQAGKTKIELDFTTTDNLKKSSFVIIIQVKETIGADPGAGTATPGNIPVNYAIDLNTLENYVQEANILSETFASNVAIQKATQDSLDASAVTAKNAADSVASSLATAQNLNTHLDEARTLNDALQADITAGTPLKNDLTSINSTAQTTKTALEADIATAEQKLAEFESFDTSGLITKVNTLQSDENTSKANITNIQNEITTARNGEATLKDGIIDLIQEHAPTSSLVDNSTFAALASDVAAARLGETTLVLGIRDAINNIVDPLKTQVNNISLSGADTTLRSEVSDARFGKSTLSLGIISKLNEGLSMLQSQIDSMTTTGGTGTSPALLNEIADARNGELTLKAGIVSVIAAVKNDLQSQINSIGSGIEDTELRAEIRNACGADSLAVKLNDIINDATALYVANSNDVADIQSDIRRVKDYNNVTLKDGIQNMIDLSVDALKNSPSAITADKLDTLNIAIMNVLVSNEKITGKSATIGGPMNIFSFVDLNDDVTITNGVYSQEKKCIEDNSMAINSIAFCYD